MPAIIRDDPDKITQELSQYNYETPNKPCSGSEKFLRPAAFDIVQGPIMSNGSCMFHSLAGESYGGS